MKDFLDQWTKSMGKMWEPWTNMMSSADWMKADAPYQVKWGSWMAAVRSTFDVNTSWWKMFMDQTEEMFFKTYKESPFYNKDIENQMREFGAGVRKTQNMSVEGVKEYLDKMEALLKDKE